MITLDRIGIKLDNFSLDNITLTVEDGEFFILLGPSGVGKTALLEAVAGLNPVCGGRTLLDGRDVTALPPEARCAVEAERAFLARLGGGCLAPATAHATLDGERMRIESLVGDLVGRRILREAGEGPRENGAAIGVELAERLLESGGCRLTWNSPRLSKF